MFHLILVVSMVGCSSKESSGESKDGKDVITVWTFPHYRENKEKNWPKGL